MSGARSYGADVVEQWGGAERMSRYPLEQPLLMSVVNPAGLTRANRYYADWGEPHGIIDVMAVGSRATARRVGTLAFGRHVDAGPIGDVELAIVRLFIPHLKRAVTISRLLEARAVEAATFAACSTASPSPSCSSRPTCGSCTPTAPARRCCAPPTRSACAPAGSPPRTASPARSTVALAAPLDRIGRRGLGIPARRARRRGTRAARPPAHPATAARPRRRGRDLRRPGRRAPPGPARRRRRALRPHALRGARARPDRRRPHQRRDRRRPRHRRVSTVRTHLLRLFEKTRTHRQADLAALLASFSLPIA